MLFELRGNGPFSAEETDRLLAQIQAYREASRSPAAAQPEAQPKAQPAPGPPPLATPQVAEPPAAPITATPLRELPPIAAPALETAGPRQVVPLAPAPLPAGAREGAAIEDGRMRADLLARIVRPAEPAAAEPVQPPVPPPSPRSLAEILAEFMEPHNIRWGELIGGLLFIIGATALVITQWETVHRFRFIVSVGVTAAMFGVGLYSHYRWKLQATSRGLLLIASLLVPLSFLSMADEMGTGGSLAMVLILAIEAAALGLFFWLLALAGRLLVRGGRWPYVLAVLGPSLAVLWAARRFNLPPSRLALAAVGCVPVLLVQGAWARICFACCGGRGWANWGPWGCSASWEQADSPWPRPWGSSAIAARRSPRCPRSCPAWPCPPPWPRCPFSWPG